MRLQSRGGNAELLTSRRSRRGIPYGVLTGTLGAKDAELAAVSQSVSTGSGRNAGVAASGLFRRSFEAECRASKVQG